jgi:hypothetical protein
VQNLLPYQELDKELERQTVQTNLSSQANWISSSTFEIVQSCFEAIINKTAHPKQVTQPVNGNEANSHHVSEPLNSKKEKL